MSKVYIDAHVITSISMVKTQLGIEVMLQQYSRSFDVNDDFFLSKNPTLPLANTYVEDSGDFSHSRE